MYVLILRQILFSLTKLVGQSNKTAPNFLFRQESVNSMFLFDANNPCGEKNCHHLFVLGEWLWMVRTQRLFLGRLPMRISTIRSMVACTPLLRLVRPTMLVVFVWKVDDLIIFDYELRLREKMSAKEGFALFWWNFF